MLETFCLTVNEWIAGGAAIAALGCFLWGMISVVFSPCHLASILAIITIQQKVATGIMFIILFAIGHCLPIVVAGSSTASVRRLMENSTWQGAGNWFRKGAGMAICLLGIYFIVYPFATHS